MAEEIRSEGHNSDSPEKEPVLEKVRRFLFGDDIFISYSRADSTYALALANELIKNNLSCFLDQWGTPPGEELPKKLINTIKRCSTMVLVGSKNAGESDNVGLEIREFLETERPIIPITFVSDHLAVNTPDDLNPQDLAGTLEQAKWYSSIEGIAKTTEISSALKDLVTMIDVVMEQATDSGEYELSASGRWIIIERMSGKIFYWDTQTGKKRILDQCWENRIYTSDENRLVTNCADGTIKFWDLRSGQEVLSISNDQPDIDRQSFSPREDYLLTVSDKAVKLWRIKF